MGISSRLRTTVAAISILVGLTPGLGCAQEADGGTAVGDVGGVSEAELGRVVATKPPYSPALSRNFPTRPLFGDTHLHTAVSLDAGTAGARLTPADAYRLAKGERITASSGQPVQLTRPLDFLVVADHSDNMGFFPKLSSGDPAFLADPTGKRWYDMMAAGKGMAATLEIIQAMSTNTFPAALSISPESKAFSDVWNETIDAAEAFNDPGRFTAFIGYEWTSQAAYNIHRNVIYRDGGSYARQVMPFTVSPPLGSPHEPDLYAWMAAYEEKTGGDVLAIAHNGNLSNGLMFPTGNQPFTDKAVDSAYVEARAKWEPLYEVTQTKGTGEAHPLLSPNDELANFEIWDLGNLNLSEAKTPEMLPHEYARSGLKLGLELERKFGTNPYKFGMIGSTDAHTGLSAVEEDNFWGKVTPMEPNPERLTNTFIADKTTGLKLMEWQVSSSGYAAVWATDNTRASIFDAMERRETYATTGSRMTVRFFGGYDFAAEDATSRNPAMIGYAKGVPMGGDLAPDAQGRAPSFLVAALRDPIGANLDRYQIVKGWMDADGKTHEQVYDVAWSDGRVAGADGKLPSVGSTVDVTNATWANTIGAPELIAVWTDPDFDPTQPAFYYGRVIEIPTPRWTAYDVRYFGNTPLPGTVMEITERAYTSPIWYNPAK
jgi:hypothetical protein